MENTTLLGQSLRIIKNDALVVTPAIAFFVIVQILESKGVRFAAPVTSFAMSKGQLIFLAATSVFSETVVKPIIITWAGQSLIGGRAYAGIFSVRQMLRSFLHILISLLLVVIPVAMMGFAIFAVLSKFVLVAVGMCGLVGLAAVVHLQFVPQFIVFERLSAINALKSSIQLVRTNWRLAGWTLISGVSVVMVAGIVSSVLYPIEVVGPTLSAIINAVGTVVFIGMQTVAYFAARSRYSTVA